MRSFFVVEGALTHSCRWVGLTFMSCYSWYVPMIERQVVIWCELELGMSQGSWVRYRSVERCQEGLV